MSSAMDTSSQSSPTSLPFDYNKRLMLFSGRANPQLAADIATKLNVDLGPVTLKTFSNGEVYCRYEDSIRGADVFIVQPTCGNPQTGVTANDSLMELLFMIDAAGGADLGSSGRPYVGGGGGRQGADDGSARGADTGVLSEAGRPHDGAVHAHAVLRRPRALGSGGRGAGRREGQAEQEVRVEDRCRAGDPRQG